MKLSLSTGHNKHVTSFDVTQLSCHLANTIEQGNNCGSTRLFQRQRAHQQSFLPHERVSSPCSPANHTRCSTRFSFFTRPRPDRRSLCIFLFLSPFFFAYLSNFTMLHTIIRIIGSYNGSYTTVFSRQYIRMRPRSLCNRQSKRRRPLNPLSKAGYRYTAMLENRFCASYGATFGALSRVCFRTLLTRREMFIINIVILFISKYLIYFPYLAIL